MSARSSSVARGVAAISSCKRVVRNASVVIFSWHFAVKWVSMVYARAPPVATAAPTAKRTRPTFDEFSIAPARAARHGFSAERSASRLQLKGRRDAQEAWLARARQAETTAQSMRSRRERRDALRKIRKAIRLLPRSV